MTTKDIKTLAYKVYESINKKDEIALRELFHPNVIRHAMGEIGVDFAIKSMLLAFESFPSTFFVVEDAIAEDNRVALRITIQGRENIPTKPLPLILEVFRFEDYKIIEVWGAGISSDKFPQ